MTKGKQMELYKAILKEYPDVLTIEEMCKALGINRRTAYRLLKENKIQYLWIGNKYRIPKIHILTYLKVSLLPA